MRYSLGSISKQFTAAAILLLAENGGLSLDDLAASSRTVFAVAMSASGSCSRISRNIRISGRKSSFRHSCAANSTEKILDL
jgi:Beta-lactamase